MKIKWLVVILCIAALSACTPAPTVNPNGAVSETKNSVSESDQRLARAFDQRASHLQVEGTGTVRRLLSDDNEGSRHQRFIVELKTGQTILISHNIDLAPRIVSLEVGDEVGFFGEYEWNEKGGTIHWTHHDPDGRHATGWIKHEGRIYQ